MGNNLLFISFHVKSSASPESPNNTAGSSVTKPNIPQELIQGTMPPPMPEEGTYVKVLLEGLPWDIYREHTAGRLFYVNRDTGERMWKPPRKPIPQQVLVSCIFLYSFIFPFSHLANFQVLTDVENCIMGHTSLFFDMHNQERESLLLITVGLTASKFESSFQCFVM